ncbi:hypothetical protein AHAS_Ahas16G0171300 [Arachis hypogaea]
MYGSNKRCAVLRIEIDGGPIEGFFSLLKKIAISCRLNAPSYYNDRVNDLVASLLGMQIVLSTVNLFFPFFLEMGHNMIFFFSTQVCVSDLIITTQEESWVPLNKPTQVSKDKQGTTPTSSRGSRMAASRYQQASEVAPKKSLDLTSRPKATQFQVTLKTLAPLSGTWKTENQDDIDAVIVGVLVDPKEARAGIREVHFFPFNPGDKRTALTYIESDGNWHISSKGAPEQILNLCNYKEDVKRKAMQLLLSLLSVGSDLWGLLDSFGKKRILTFIEVPEKSKDAHGALWQFLALLPLFDPPRHDSTETITRDLNLGVNVKMITVISLLLPRKLEEGLAWEQTCTLHPHCLKLPQEFGSNSNNAISAYCSRSRAWLSIKRYQPPLPADQVKSLNEYDEEGEASRRGTNLYSFFPLSEEMFHFYWIKDSRHRCTASFTHCQMTCPYNLLCWLCNWECDKDTVREGEHVFGVAHIFASFNDTFIHVTDLSRKETLVCITGKCVSLPIALSYKQRFLLHGYFIL